MALDLTPPPSAQLHCAWTFVHVREYVWIVCFEQCMHWPPSFLWPEQLRPLRPFTIFIHWLRLTSPLLSTIFIHRWILFWIESHLFLLWNVFHVFHSTIPWVWCMSFCEIILSLMTLLVTLIFFWDTRAHHSWSFFSINIMFVCCIATFGFGKTSRRCSTHRN
jgi:hypothetical protein